MRFFSLCRLAAISSIAGACATHPLPKDVAGFDTVQIVERIRCEAVNAIKIEAINLLAARGDPMAETLRDYPEQFIKFNPDRLKGASERYFYNRYIDSAIVYDFTLEAMEENNDTTEIDLLKAVTNGTATLVLKAGNDRIRDNSRGFVIVEKFKTLLDDKQVCNLHRREKSYAVDNLGVPNSQYPISGYIGLSEVIDTFIRLNQDGLLSSQTKDKAPVLTDTLTFTTTLTATANPQVMLNPVGKNVGLKLASLSEAVTRKDYHKLIVSLSLEPRRGYENAPVDAPLVGAGARGASVFATRGVGQAAQRALDADTQQRINTFYDRAGRFLAQ